MPKVIISEFMDEAAIAAELAGLVTPMANGIEWSLFEGQVKYNSTVLIQGPGQQGLSQVVACKQAGADLIIPDCEELGLATGLPRGLQQRQQSGPARHVVELDRRAAIALAIDDGKLYSLNQWYLVEDDDAPSDAKARGRARVASR